MRQFTAIFLIALVGLTFAAKVKVAGSPADAVLEKIDDLVQSSRNEQAEQTRIYVAQHDRCEDEEEFRTKEVNDASIAAGAAEQQLNLCQNEVPVAQAAQARSADELQVSQQQLKDLNAQYAEYRDANLERHQAHVDALENIQAAYNIIGNFANGKAALDNAAFFLQVTQKLNAVFKTAVKHRFHKHMVPVMSALVQLTQGPAAALSTDALTRVVNLFRQLEANVRQSENDRAAEWANYEAGYNTQGDLLEDQIEGLSAINEKYSDYLQNLAACVRVESNVLALAQAKLQRNQQILDASVEMCDAFDAKYNQQTQERADYVALLGQLRSFVVSAISDYNSGEYSSGDFVNEVQVKSTKTSRK